MEKLTTSWGPTLSRLWTEVQAYEQTINWVTSTANAFFLVGVIALVILRLTDGVPKRTPERLFLACIGMGAFMQIFPFPNPDGIDWDTLLFRMGLFGWGVNALYLAVRERINDWKR